MKAVMYENFSEAPKLVTLPDPVPEGRQCGDKSDSHGLVP